MTDVTHSLNLKLAHVSGTADKFMNMKEFFNFVRREIFNGRLSQQQVDGMQKLLDVWFHYLHPNDHSVKHLAYCLGTCPVETGNTFQPIKERGGREYLHRMYDIQGARPTKALELGNDKPGDGVKYAGEGHVQNTGKRNARKATTELNNQFNLGVDLVRYPSQRGHFLVSALSLYFGTIQGWWTGAGLTKYLNGEKRDWINARRTVNGVDRARQIAATSQVFYTAIREAMDRQKYAANQQPEKVATGKPLTKSKTGWSAIAGALLTLFGASDQVKKHIGDYSELLGVSPLVVIGLAAAGVAGFIIWERYLKSYRYGV